MMKSYNPNFSKDLKLVNKNLNPILFFLTVFL